MSNRVGATICLRNAEGRSHPLKQGSAPYPLYGTDVDELVSGRVVGAYGEDGFHSATLAHSLSTRPSVHLRDSQLDSYG